MDRIKQRNENTYKRRSRLFLVVAIVLFVGIFLAFTTYIAGLWGRPISSRKSEIVRQYHGTYYTSLSPGSAPEQSKLYDCTINITSCTQSGKLTGYFEFSQDNERANLDIYGKCAITTTLTA